MNVTVTGGTGFVGRHLVKRLADAGYSITILGRMPRPGAFVFAWDAIHDEPPAESLADAGAIVHLAGDPIAQHWTRDAKQKMRDSRILGTRNLVQALSKLLKRPEVLICASAIGYYGSRDDEVLTEASGPGVGFLPELCQEWEKEADGAEALGIRVVKLRTGIVLSKDGGALGKMLRPFKMGVGGRLGSGKQWMSWIHISDLTGLIQFAIEQPGLRGAVNGTAPNPVTNSEFTETLGRALHRPAFLPVPAFALKALFGEMSSVLLEGQRVLPRAAETAGYVFKHPDLGGALEEIFAR